MQRGFTLIEVTVAVAVLVMIVAAGASFALGSNPFAMRSAVTQFNAQLQAAKALAATSGNGATIIVQTRPGTTGSADFVGFKSIVYAGRPSTGATLSASNIAPLVSDAVVSESAIGSAPFAIFISSSGHISMQPAYPSAANYDSTNPGALASEPNTCPASNQYVLNFTANGTTDQLVLPCKIALLGTPEPTITATPGATPTAIATNSPIPTPTPSATATPIPTPIPTPTPSSTPCAGGGCTTPTPTPTPTRAPTPTPSPSYATCGGKLCVVESWIDSGGGGADAGYSGGAGLAYLASDGRTTLECENAGGGAITSTCGVYFDGNLVGDASNNGSFQAINGDIANPDTAAGWINNEASCASAGGDSPTMSRQDPGGPPAGFNTDHWLYPNASAGANQSVFAAYTFGEAQAAIAWQYVVNAQNGGSIYGLYHFYGDQLCQ